MENKEIKLNIQLTDRDYLKFQTDHAGYFKRSRWMIYGIFVAFFVVSDLIGNGFSGLSLTSIIPTVVFCSVIAISIFSFRAKIKSAFKSDTTLQHPMEITFNNEGLIINAYRANTNPLWEGIYRYVITKNTIYVYTAENKSLIIPKRFFENENDLNTVVELLKNKVDQSKYKKQSSKIKYISWFIPLILLVPILLYVFFGNSGGNKKQNQAWEYENNHDFKSAAKIYTELINDNPEESINYANRAQCEIELGDYKLAILDCEKAIKIKPESGYAYYIYAFALYNEGRYEEACKAIHKSIETSYTKEDYGLCDPPEN